MRRTKSPVQLLIPVLLVLAALALSGLLAAVEVAIAPATRVIGNPPNDLAIKPVSMVDRFGKTVSGWSIDGNADRGAVLLLHGVRSDRRAMLERSRFLSRHGFSVLMIDLQAHGESPGEKITFGHREAESVSAAIRFAREKWPEKRLGIIGLSLGGASAIFAAENARADAYVLEAVYSDLPTATENRLRIRFGEFGPPLAQLLLAFGALRLGFDADELSVVGRIHELKAPAFFIAGEGDRRTTLQESKAIFANARPPRSLWVIPQGKHQDFLRMRPNEYRTRVLEFLDRHL